MSYNEPQEVLHRGKIEEELRNFPVNEQENGGGAGGNPDLQIRDVVRKLDDLLYRMEPEYRKHKRGRYQVPINEGNNLDVWIGIYLSLRSRGIPPTQGELRDRLGLSKSAVQRAMWRLEGAGVIELIPSVSRGITLKKRPPGYEQDTKPMPYSDRK